MPRTASTSWEQAAPPCSTKRRCCRLTAPAVSLQLPAASCVALSSALRAAWSLALRAHAFRLRRGFPQVGLVHLASRFPTFPLLRHEVHHLRRPCAGVLGALREAGRAPAAFFRPGACGTGRGYGRARLRQRTRTRQRTGQCARQRGARALSAPRRGLGSPDSVVWLPRFRCRPSAAARARRGPPFGLAPCRAARRAAAPQAHGGGPQKDVWARVWFRRRARLRPVFSLLPPRAPACAPRARLTHRPQASARTLLQSNACAQNAAQIQSVREP